MHVTRLSASRRNVAKFWARETNSKKNVVPRQVHVFDIILVLWSRLCYNSDDPFFNWRQKTIRLTTTSVLVQHKPACPINGRLHRRTSVGRRPLNKAHGSIYRARQEKSECAMESLLSGSQYWENHALQQHVCPTSRLILCTAGFQRTIL